MIPILRLEAQERHKIPYPCHSSTHHFNFYLSLPRPTARAAHTNISKYEPPNPPKSPPKPPNLYSIISKYLRETSEDSYIIPIILFYSSYKICSAVKLNLIFVPIIGVGGNLLSAAHLLSIHVWCLARCGSRSTAVSLYYTLPTNLRTSVL